MSVDPLIKAVTPETKWYVVLRPFDADRRLARGEVVDTSSWMHLDRLVDLRYVAPLPHGAEVPSPNSDGIRLIALDDQQKEQVPAKKRPVPTRKTTKATA